MTAPTSVPLWIVALQQSGELRDSFYATIDERRARLAELIADAAADWDTILIARGERRALYALRQLIEQEDRNAAQRAQHALDTGRRPSPNPGRRYNGNPIV
jgi:hypothetical protein